MYSTIKTQILTMIAELTANPKPTYNIDGQTVQWTEYLKQLQAAADWCDLQIKKTEIPIEEITITY